MKPSVTVLLLLATAYPALANVPQKGGFGVSDLEAAANSVDNRAAELAGETERLRLAMAYDTALGLSTRSEAERAVLLGALPTSEGAGDLRVQWFMAGAIAQPPKGSTTVLYNPLARGTLALDWVKEGDGWRVAHAWLSSPGPAQWPASSDPWRKAFAADYLIARAYSGDMGRNWVPFESDRWLGSLALAMKDPAKRAGIESATKLIADGRTAKAGAGIIERLPVGTRATYAPVGAITRQDGGIAVIYGSPLLPQTLIAGDFSSGGSLEKLSLVNLGGVK